jgi:hypothetical protein
LSDYDLKRVHVIRKSGDTDLPSGVHTGMNKIRPVSICGVVSNRAGPYNEAYKNETWRPEDTISCARKNTINMQKFLAFL